MCWSLPPGRDMSIKSASKTGRITQTFSAKEPLRGGGPYRFSIDEIDSVFSDRFVRESFKETVYQGTLDILPKALFVVLRKKT